jgi:exodeoxyribonuclease V alpha subunit
MSLLEERDMSDTQHQSLLPAQVGRLLARLDHQRAGIMAAAGKALVEAWAAGHSCLLAGDRLDSSAGIFPQNWLDELRASHLTGNASGMGVPLVLEADNRLYLQRHHEAESRIAKQLKRLAAMKPRSHDTLKRQELLDRVFPPGPDGTAHSARPAAEAALSHPFVIVTGGPGTGKTTLVLRVLALLQNLESRPLQIELAAPTGKAAARMEESIRLGLERVSQEITLPESLPKTARTIHSLLVREVERLRSCDLLVVDEASMVDLNLMSQLLDGLAPTTGLILLGDPDQLASVEAGAVLADMIEGMKDHPGNHVNRLTQTHRFSNQDPLGLLADAIRQGRADEACQLLEAGHDDLQWVEQSSEYDKALYRQVLPSIDEALAMPDPADALRALEAWRLLTVLRQGPFGSEQINQRMARRLQGRGRHTPLLITRNDPSLRLSNGDTGLLLMNEDGRVWFPAGGEHLQSRKLPLAFLPDHEHAWALTVHKSQGSEFDRVAVLLPPADSPLLSRELLFTAVTRARKGLLLMGERDSIIRCVKRPASRMSGLAERLKA